MNRYSLLPLLGVLALAGCGQADLPDPRPNLAEVKTIREKLAAAAPAAVAETTDAAPTGTGWATLKGRFVYDGAVPEPIFLPCDKDSGTCCKEKILDERLTVASDGGLANVIVFLRSNPSRLNPETEKNAETAVILDNLKCVFRPHVSVVWTKQKLLLKNSDDVGHNTNYSSPNNGFNALLAAGGAPLEKQFSKTENKPESVSCNIHGWMAAKLLVRDNPYFAVTKADGTFEIPNLPAGEKLEFQVWHELNGQLEFAAGDVKAGKGRFTVTLAENDTKALDVKIAAAALPRP